MRSTAWQSARLFRRPGHRSIAATLGQSVAADGELYRVANLSRVTIAASLSPADAGKVRAWNTR